MTDKKSGSLGKKSKLRWRTSLQAKYIRLK